MRTYTNIKILVVGWKQSEYTLDKEQTQRTRFSEKDILDIDDVCKLAMDLSIDKLQSLYNHVRNETIRMKVALEVPDEEGPITAYDYIEKIPQPKMSDFARYADSKSVHQVQTREVVEKEFHDFSAELAKLPRITREVFAILIERRDSDKKRLVGLSRFRVNADRLKRILNYPDLEGELRILQEHGFVVRNRSRH